MEMIENTERTEYYPLGTIVTISGGIKKIMIIARGVATKLDGKTQAFDYGGCPYPEGMIEDQLLFFNHEDIAKVAFEGFSDEDNVLMVEYINDWQKTATYEKGNPRAINQEERQNE